MDPIADFINRIKNASAAGLASTNVPSSKMAAAIAEILKKKGFIKSFTLPKTTQKTIEVEIAYKEGGEPQVLGARRVSKLSRRVYRKAKDLRPIRRGFGTAILSTPKGLMTDIEARKAKLGGEVLFEIW